MADNKQSTLDSKTILSSAGGNIETSNSIGGANLILTHPSGSNLQFGNATTSSFNSGNTQTLTLADAFSTTNGDSNQYIKGSNETRVEGDSIDFIGPALLLTNNVMDRWYKEYGDGYASIKSQWDDNRSDLAPSDFPINTVYSPPAGIANISSCPPLKDGTAEDNKDDETRAKLEKEMMDPETIKNSDASKALQKQLTETYNNFNNNAESLYNSQNGKK